MTTIQGVILGLLQGLTELFPVSSLGHSVLLPHLLRWNINESNNSFLLFLVATHLATSLVLFGFFWRDWFSIVKGIIRSFKERVISDEDTYAKLGWLLVVATIPAGIIGLLFQETLTNLFASPIPVSIFLALNGLMLLGIERFKSKKKTIEGQEVSVPKITKLSWGDSIKIGFAQCLALLPGFSRTGSTLGGGLITGLDHVDAAHFSFLLATPIIFAAAVLKLPDLVTGTSHTDVVTIIVGSICAAIAAWIAISFLSKYFKTKTLTPFGIYCLSLGLVSLLYFIL